MARWKLSCSHYLNTVKPAKWRYSHADRATGELIEQEFIVPRMLDVRDPKCWTNRFSAGTPVSRGGNNMDAEGEIIVCHQGKGEPSDIEFIGNPTPDMVPQDEEAQAISDSFQAHWAYKPDVPEVQFSQAIVDRSAAAVTPAPVQVEGLAELVAMMAEGQAQTRELIASLTSGRRI